MFATRAARQAAGRHCASGENLLEPAKTTPIVQNNAPIHNSGWLHRNRLIPGPFCIIFRADSESGLKIDFSKFEKVAGVAKTLADCFCLGYGLCVGYFWRNLALTLL